MTNKPRKLSKLSRQYDQDNLKCAGIILQNPQKYGGPQSLGRYLGTPSHQAADGDRLGMEMPILWPHQPRHRLVSFLRKLRSCSMTPATNYKPCAADWGPECRRPLKEEEPQATHQPEDKTDLRTLERVGRTSTPYPDLFVWNGKYTLFRNAEDPEWVSWLEYVFSIQPKSISVPSRAIRLSATCSQTYVEIKKTHDDHYHLFARAVGATQISRRKDFTTIFLEHAQRTGEAWYGHPTDGWRVEETAEES